MEAIEYFERPSMDVWQLKSWMEQEEEDNRNPLSFDGKPNHISPPFLIDDGLNSKICLW